MSKRFGKYTLLTSSLLLSFVPVSIAQVPQVNHVFVVVEENSNYTNVIGNPAMPYLNSLANQYGLATNYFADTHPSIGNYFMLTTGQILTNDDGQTPSSFPVTVDNLVRELLAGGKTWKSYAESLPSVGYLGGDSGQYAVRHNSFPYFSDVQNSTAQQQNLVPFEDPSVGFAHDLANNAFPNFSFIVPNLCDDAHDCPLPTADAWLQAHIDPLLKSALFQNDGLLVIVFDESDTDNTNGGGHIPMLVISPKGKMAYQSTTLYQHESTLRMICEAAGCAALPGAAAQAPDMVEFFGNPAPPNGSDFGLSSSPPSQSVTQGGSASYTLSISASGGFTGSVSLSASGLPNGATATFSPSAATTSSTVTVTTTAATPTGSFPVTITGTGGALTHTASVTLVVNAALTPDFTLSSSPASQSVVQGASTSFTVNITPSGGFSGSVNFSASGMPSGAVASFSPNPATGISTTMTVSTSATTATGSFPVTITGIGGTLTHTASATLVVNAATPVVTPPTPPVNPPTPPVTPPTPPVTPHTPPVTPPTPPVTPPTPPVNAPAPAQGAFSLAVTPSSQLGNPNTTVEYMVTVASSGGNTGTIDLHVQGLPRGAKASFSPASMQNGGSSTLTVSLGESVRTRKYQLTIVGRSQHLRRKTSVVLTTVEQHSNSEATSRELDDD